MAATEDLVPETTDPLDGIQIVDADAHFTEPADLWTARAPAGLVDRVPQMRTVDGRSAWYLDGEVWASIGGNTIGANATKVLGSHMIQPFEDIDAAAWRVPDRLSLMDKLGIWAQIIYPNGIGFASNHIFAIPDLQQRTAVLQIYNDFLLDVQAESSDRLLPQALLPIWDMELTVTEMTRLLERGIRGFTLSDKPELLGLPELPEPYFAPMWDVFQQSGSVANFHIASGARKEDFEAMRRGQVVYGMRHFDQTPIAAADAPKVAQPSWRSFGRQRELAVIATQTYLSNVRIIVNLCMSNLFDRYPNLRIVSAESGIGWIPFVLEAMDYQFSEMVTHEAEVGFSERRPAEYFRDHISVMFWFEEIGAAKLIEDVGVGNVLVETDIPHPTCLYPDPRGHFARVLEGLDDRARRRVLQTNGAELYQIDVPAEPTGSRQ